MTGSHRLLVHPERALAAFNDTLLKADLSLSGGDMRVFVDDCFLNFVYVFKRTPFAAGDHYL
jgi:hypothetical protein